MPELGQLAGPVMSGGTGFHADHAGRQRLKEAQNLAASQLPADGNDAARIDAVHLEPVLGEVKADGGNLHGGRLLSLWRSQTTTLWHIDAGSGGRPPHQDFRELFLTLTYQWVTLPVTYDRKSSVKTPP